MNHAMVRLEGISFTVLEQTILKGIHLEIGEGDFVVVIGPNGSGKSSLLKSINGTIKVSRGHIMIDNEEFTNRPVHVIARHVATLTQDLRQSTFGDLTVAMNLDLALSRTRSHEASFDKKAYLASFNSLLPERMNVLAGHLSGGQRQALALAMCFAHTPKVLLLDEHTSALDPKAEHALMELTNRHIRDKNLTTIMITHSLDHALRYGNRLIAIKEGRVAADIRDSEKTLLTKTDLMNFAYQ